MTGNGFCGVDWAEDHHAIALVDTHGQLIAKRRITDDTGAGRLTSSGVTVGTARSMAPEQFHMSAVTVADLYTLGCVLLEPGRAGGAALAVDLRRRVDAGRRGSRVHRRGCGE